MFGVIIYCWCHYSARGQLFCALGFSSALFGFSQEKSITFITKPLVSDFPFLHRPFSHGYEDRTSFEVWSALRIISMSVLCVHVLILSSTVRFAFLIIKKWNHCPSSVMWHVGICFLAVLIMTSIITLWFSLFLVSLWSNSSEPNSRSDSWSSNLKVHCSCCFANTSYLFLILKFVVSLIRMSLKQLYNFSGYINLNTPYHYYIKFSAYDI